MMKSLYSHINHRSKLAAMYEVYEKFDLTCEKVDKIKQYSEEYYYEFSKNLTMR